MVRGGPFLCARAVLPSFYAMGLFFTFHMRGLIYPSFYVQGIVLSVPPTFYLA